jgi:uncharacterized protein YbcV (DUF1398 family)
MFTTKEIEAATQKIKTGADFPQFASALKAMGVTRVDVYAINGLSIYFGDGDHTVEGAPIYESLLIEPTASIPDLQEALKIHQEGASDYQTFCKQAALAGVEKWIIDLNAMTVTYLDTTGNEMLTEDIPV